MHVSWKCPSRIISPICRFPNQSAAGFVWEVKCSSFVFFIIYFRKKLWFCTSVSPCLYCVSVGEIPNLDFWTFKFSLLICIFFFLYFLCQWGIGSPCYRLPLPSSVSDICLIGHSARTVDPRWVLMLKSPVRSRPTITYRPWVLILEMLCNFSDC